MVHEPEVDLARRDGLDDRRVLLVLLRVVLLRSTSHCRVASSPSESLIAVTNAWNDAFVGAIPIRPFHFGSVRSKTESGNLVFGQLVGVVDDHARAARRADPATVRVAELPASTRSRVSVGQLCELRVDRAERARVLREEDVGRRVLALLGDRRRELGAVAVAHLDLDPGLLGELLEERRDELFLAAGVDGQRIVGASSAARGREPPGRGRRRRPPSAFTSRNLHVRVTVAAM